MSAPNEVRHLLRGRFVIGAHPDRPAPAHLFNNFVLRAFGKGDGADRVRQYSRDSGAIDRLANHPAILTASWAEDRDLLATLADTIWIVFDPDRRVFPSFGSPLPIDKRLATPDPSDDGLGRALWESLSGREQLTIRARLAEILESESSADPASQLSQFLLEDVAVSTSPDVDANSTSEFPLLGGTIETLVKGIGEIHTGAERLEAIRQLGTLLHFCAVLGLLLEGLRFRREATSWEGALGLVVYTGLPPGDGDDPLVKAAQLSYRATLADVHSGLRDNLNARLTGELDPTIPEGVRLQSALLGMLRESGVTSPQKALDRILSAAPPPPNADQAGIEEWLDTLMTEGYPIEHLSRGLRAMANKVGFVGPVRGFGQPRFVLETPLLATLARALVAPSGSLAFDDFVRAMRTQLGLIVGINQRDKIPAGARVFGSDQVARQRLGVLGEHLRLRLIQAGLAREFSDSHTRVFAT
jgi:hypothetical protein